MRTLVGILMVVMVSGDDVVTVDVEGFVGGEVLLPCTCLTKDLNDFKWQTEGNESVRVVHVHDIGSTPNFTEKYKIRSKLFLSENSSNCSLFLKNIKREDERTYKCSFKDGIRYEYFFVNLTVSEGPAHLRNIPTPAPTEPTSPVNIRIQILYGVIPVALVSVLSLFLLYKRKVSGRPRVDEGDSEQGISELSEMNPKMTM